MNLNFKANHGLMVFALFNTLKALPDLVEGTERFIESREDGESTG
jgi:hypothetical protein